MIGSLFGLVSEDGDEAVQLTLFGSYCGWLVHYKPRHFLNKMVRHFLLSAIINLQLSESLDNLLGSMGLTLGLDELNHRRLIVSYQLLDICLQIRLDK